ncbi:hypothetical protein [Streptosporangium vulgare]|uniref:Uncharacterized protein n=1 Tax=Streptosporangium vulgare TaxID=46190 RepID=A0ABV5TD36_9ACTN
MRPTIDSPFRLAVGSGPESAAEITVEEVIPMIAISMIESADVSEKQPDCCTAMRGRKNLDVLTSVMVDDPDGCD